MKKSILLLIASILLPMSIYAGNVRIAATNGSTSTETNPQATFSIMLPITGTIYLGGAGSNSIVGEPLFVTNNNEVILHFTYSHSCGSTSKEHYLKITNSYNYTETIKVGTSGSCECIVPIKENDDTTISIELIAK